MNASRSQYNVIEKFHLLPLISLKGYIGLYGHSIFSRSSQGEHGITISIKMYNALIYNFYNSTNKAFKTGNPLLSSFGSII